ncbi:MAG: DUF4266 domain-containing protein [Nibricoccus sp.]
MKRAAFLIFCFFLGGVGLVLSGCTTVQPWERATLADYTMRPDRDGLATAMTEHIYFSREASSGGRGVGGSGCGCN